MNFATTKERIIHFIDNQRIKPKDFLTKTDIKRGFLDSDKLKATVSDVFITKIIAKYPEINLEWLITGNGSMLKGPQKNIASSFVTERRSNDVLMHQKVPVFNLDSIIGLIPLTDNDELDKEKIIDYISIPNIPSSDGAIYVNGDSMYPILKSGDIITYKRIDIDPQKIFFGEMYVLAIKIDENTTLKTIKFIQKSDLGTNYIKLVSHNQHHIFKDVCLDEITAIGLVRASIRLHN